MVACTIHLCLSALLFVLLPSNNISPPISSQIHSWPYIVRHKKHGMPRGKFTICCMRKSMNSSLERPVANMIHNSLQKLICFDLFYDTISTDHLTILACPIVFLSWKHNKKGYTWDNAYNEFHCIGSTYTKNICCWALCLFYIVCKISSSTNFSSQFFY